MLTESLQMADMAGVDEVEDSQIAQVVGFIGSPEQEYPLNPNVAYVVVHGDTFD